MINRELILKVAGEKGVVKTQDFVGKYKVSRQYVSQLIGQLVKEKKLIKLGETRGVIYVSPDYLGKVRAYIPRRYVKRLKNKNLEEHLVLEDLQDHFLSYKELPENIKSIFAYAFLEMLNNAIDHSHTKEIKVMVSWLNDQLTFVIDDSGVGVFRNIMQKRKLKNELEAIQDLLKGKTTTAPKLHSGEGIFFTSKVADEFVLDSYGQQLIIDNKIDDLFVKKVAGQKQGTRVTFTINTKSDRHLNDVFRNYTNISENSDHGFDKTEIRVKLYTRGGVNISRSQARRVLSGLEKFSVVVMDYSDVPMVGQAFADEIYRVFKNRFPNIEIKNEQMNEGVEFMVKRAINEAAKNINN